jgi:hypothetical protein
MARPKGGEAKKKDPNYKPFANKSETAEPNDDRIIKATAKEKETLNSAIKKMLIGNIDNLETWLTEIGKLNPSKAMDIYVSFAEFVIPKQNRNSTQDKQAPVTVNFIAASQSKKESSKEQIKEAIDELLN